MNLKTLTMRLEISFWNLAIDLLSYSPVCQSLVPWVYSQLSRRWMNRSRTLKPAYALAWAAAGLLLGFLVGFVGGI